MERLEVKRPRTVLDEAVYDFVNSLGLEYRIVGKYVPVALGRSRHVIVVDVLVEDVDSAEKKLNGWMRDEEGLFYRKERPYPKFRINEYDPLPESIELIIGDYSFYIAPVELQMVWLLKEDVDDAYFLRVYFNDFSMEKVKELAAELKVEDMLWALDIEVDQRQDDKWRSRFRPTVITVGMIKEGSEAFWSGYLNYINSYYEKVNRNGLPKGRNLRPPGCPAA